SDQTPAPAPAPTAEAPAAEAPAADRPDAATADADRLLAGLDIGLSLLVLALAFLLASFAVKNSDFWLHLATGRDLAQGRYSFGTDPYSFTTEGRYWVNHSWLFDLILYYLYQLGGPAVVLAKAALVTATAGVVLLLCRKLPAGAADT